MVIGPDCSARLFTIPDMRPVFDWRLRSRTLKLGERTLVMGILNVTPDSFSDGGRFLDPDCAIDHGLELLRQGADILDIGGESTRPGAQAGVDVEEEKQRVLPVIAGILREAPEAVISVDTYKAETAKAAVAAGAEIVNDVSGFSWDEQMRSTLADVRCGCVLMHTRGRPEEWRTLPALPPDEVVPLVMRELERLLSRATEAGIDRERIVLDPGFGFGKRLDENYPLLAGLGELHRVGFPLLTGTSRKSFLAKSADSYAQASTRVAGTIATATASILQGVHIVRVHDVLQVVEAARVADAIVQAECVKPQRFPAGH